MGGELRFPSKIDWWLIALPIVAVAAAPMVIVMKGKPGQVTGATFIPLAISLVVPIGIFASMFSSTVYVVSGNDLRIKCGPIKLVVPIDSISRIRGCRNPASAPALSLSRLEIHYGRFNEVLISPKDRQAFLRAIVARVPNVVLENLDEYR